MEEKNPKMFITPIIAIVVFLLLIFGATYAYFASSVTLNSANYQINMPSTTSLICTKTDCGATVTPAMMINTAYNNSTPKASSTCYVDCTCSGTEGAVCNYNVTLLEKGATYTPSSGLGTNKEFTIKVTSPSGCTAQNSSSTETQVNTQSGKMVSACSLTVPAGGTISANVSAEFKWYNLNLDQSSHARQIYEYELSTANRMIIYRNTTDEANIGDNISVLTSGYETDRNNITQVYYLKHIVENNIIVASYACIKYTESGVFKEACVQGGNESYYGTYTGMSSSQVSNISGATGNIQRVQNIQSYITGIGGTCTYSNSESTCMASDLSYLFGCFSDGSVEIMGWVNPPSIMTGYCDIEPDGLSYCL